MEKERMPPRHHSTLPAIQGADTMRNVNAILSLRSFFILILLCKSNQYE